MEIPNECITKDDLKTFIRRAKATSCTNNYLKSNIMLLYENIPTDSFDNIKNVRKRSHLKQ